MPIIPPPRSIASPSTTTTTTASFPSPPPPPASAFLSAPGNMTAAGTTAASMAYSPYASQQLQPPSLQPTPAYGSMGAGSISSSMMGGGYQQQQMPPQLPQEAMPRGGLDPFLQPPAMQGQQQQQQQPARPASYPQPTTATGGPGGMSQNPFDFL